MRSETVNRKGGVVEEVLVKGRLKAGALNGGFADGY